MGPSLCTPIPVPGTSPGENVPGSPGDITTKYDCQRRQGNAEPHRWGHFETRSSLKGEVTPSQPLLDRDHLLTTASSREVATNPTRSPVNTHGLQDTSRPAQPLPPAPAPPQPGPHRSWGRAIMVASDSSSKCYHLLSLSCLLTKAVAFDLDYTS